MKKYINKFIIIVMIFALIPAGIVLGETKESVEIVNAVYPTYELQKDDTFKFGLSFKNNSEYVMREVEVEVVNSSFNTINEAGIRKIAEVKAGKMTYVEPFTLFYNGGTESRLFLKIRYKYGAEEIVREKVVYYTMKVKPGKDGNEGPSKPELYKPFIVMVNDKQPELNEQTEENISIQFKNDSKFAAEKVKITGLFSESNYELAEISPVKYIESIDGNETKKITYRIKGKKGIKSGVYPVGIKIEYENEYGEKFTDNMTAYVKYTGTEIETNVDLLDISDEHTVIAGDDFKLDFTIKNLSKTGIKSVSVELLELEGNNIINKNSNYKNTEDIAAEKEAMVSFQMSAGESTKTGNYKIKAMVKYTDAVGNKKEFEKYFYRKVEKHASEIFVGGLSSDKQIIKSEEEFVIKVPIYNYGKKMAENIRVSVQGEAGVINATSNIVLIPEIEANDMKELEFKFKTTPKVTEGNKNIVIKIYEGEVEKTISYVVYTEAEKKEEGNTSVPKVIISKYKPEPTMVKAGKNFDLNLALLNTHREKTVRNIKITLTTSESSDKTGSVFSPVNSSNTYFIDEITPKQESEMNITMFTIPDAKSKTYTINVTMEYEDEDGNPHSATDIIGIPVRQQSKFMTSDINVPENSEMGRAIRLDIDINNNGKIELANFTVKVEGDFSTQSSTKYIGSIQPGSREYYDVDLMPTKEGINKGVFIFSYEEPSGDIVEVRKEFASTAAKPYVPEFNGNDGEVGPPMPPVKKGFPWVKVLLGVGAVAVLIIVIVATKREKKKKEMELDE